MVWAALVTLAGCGGKASDDAVEPEPPTLPPPAGFAPSSAAPGAVRPPSRGSSGAGSSSGGAIGSNPFRYRPRRDPSSDDPPATEPATPTAPAALAEVVLTTFCGDCHGERAIENGNVQGGIDYITDIDRLTLERWIIPLRSGESPLIQMVSEGRMPPPGVEPRPTNDDILILRSFIDDPLLWPYDEPPAVDAGVPPVVDAGVPPVRSDAGEG